MTSRAKTLLRATLFALASLGSRSPVDADATITLDPSATYQTITGWEAVCWAANDSDAFSRFINEVCDRVVNDVGITRIRLEVRAGAENSEDYWSQYRSGQIPYETWRCKRYATVNDDGDPDHINPTGFHFSELDWAVSHIVAPLKQRVEANGDHLFVNVNYVAFTGQIRDCGEYLHDDPEEYAEFVLATYLHLRDTYGWVPDAWEVILEPDNVSQWNGTVIGKAIAAAAPRLQAHGITPRFIAPSTTSMANASTYFDEMASSTPAALPYLSEICYHRYGGVSAANLAKIVDRATRHQLDTSMLEWWSSGNTYGTLHEDLKLGRNSAWQRGVLVGEGSPDNTAKLCTVDVSDPDDPKVTLNHGTKYLRQYLRFVCVGAVRVGATSNDGDFDPLAFINRDGSYAVVVKAGRGGAFSIRGLPPGTYGVKYTTGSGNNPPVEYDVDLPDTTVSKDQALSTGIPREGVITIFGRPNTTSQFIRGDVDGTGDFGLRDAILTLLFIFGSIRPAVDCVSAMDLDDNGDIALSDVIRLLLGIFVQGTPDPPPPSDGCGVDPTPDNLGCAGSTQACR